MGHYAAEPASTKARIHKSKDTHYSTTRSGQTVYSVGGQMQQYLHAFRNPASSI